MPNKCLVATRNAQFYGKHYVIYKPQAYVSHNKVITHYSKLRKKYAVFPIKIDNLSD